MCLRSPAETSPRGNEAAASAHLRKAEQRVQSFQQDTNEFVQEQFSYAAGEATGQGLIKRSAP